RGRPLGRPYLDGVRHPDDGHARLLGETGLDESRRGPELVDAFEGGTPRFGEAGELPVPRGDVVAAGEEGGTQAPARLRHLVGVDVEDAHTVRVLRAEPVPEREIRVLLREVLPPSVRVPDVERYARGREGGGRGANVLADAEDAVGMTHEHRARLGRR